MYHLERIQKQLQEVLQLAIAHELPEFGFVNVAAVVLKPDQRSAVVYVTAARHTKELITKLSEKRGSIAAHLREKTELRFMPKLEFLFDEHTRRIEKIIEKLHQ